MRDVILMAMAGIGLTGAAHATDKSAAPTGDIVAWFTTDDYPAEALAAGAEGTASIAYDIDVMGRVTFCAVTQSSGSVALDDTSCRLMKERGRFTPALDAKGRPIPSKGARRVTWQIPNVSMPMKEASSRVVRVLDVDEEGEVTGCSVVEAVQGGIDMQGEARKALCEGMAEAFRSRGGMVDDNGRPTKVRLQFTTEMKVLPAAAGK